MSWKSRPRNEILRRTWTLDAWNTAIDWGKSHPREASSFLRHQGIEGSFENLTSECLRCIGFTALYEAGRIEAASGGERAGPTPEPTATLRSITCLIENLSTGFQRLNDRVHTLELGNGVQIVIKHLFNYTFTFPALTYEFKLSDTIAMVKEKIREDQGVPVELQVLIFAGMVLEDGHTLASYGIQEESVLVLMVKIHEDDEDEAEADEEEADEDGDDGDEADEDEANEDDGDENEDDDDDEEELDEDGNSLSVMSIGRSL